MKSGATCLELNGPLSYRPSRFRRAAGMTLVEVMIGLALSGTVISIATSLWIFASRNFASMANYTELDAKSRNAVDQISRTVREATQLTDFQMTGDTKWFTVTNTTLGTGATYIWRAANRTVACQRSGEEEIYLTECDRWDFQLYQRSPQINGIYVFVPATNSAGVCDASICKLINMTWKCSRTILGTPQNTESVQTAQVVLRNKQ